jgi:hypothetical protein
MFVVLSAFIWWVPIQLMTAYKGLVLICHPLMIVAEGVSAMTLVFSSGQLWGPTLASQSWPVQAALLIGCVAISGWSILSMVRMYAAGIIGSIEGATNTAISLTLLLVLAVATLFVPHASITDATLLILYVTYNIWLACTMSMDELVRPKTPSEYQWLFPINETSRLWSMSLSRLLPFGVLQASVFDLVTLVYEVFSIQIVTTILIQMAIFVACLRMCRLAMIGGEGDHFSDPILAASGLDKHAPDCACCCEHSEKSNYQSPFLKWLVSVFWPCFGRSVIVILFTRPLIGTQHAGSSFHSGSPGSEADGWPSLMALVNITRASPWRWINVYVCLAIFIWHLLVEP